MIRIIIFLLSILLLVATTTYLAGLDSRISADVFGLRFDEPTGIILGGLLLLMLVAIYLTHKIKDILATPEKLRQRAREAKRIKGVAALTRGLEAVAVGDGASARHYAKVAHNHLDDLGLTRLLSAQAAHLSGDVDSARQSFEAMTSSPESEFLGLKGLFLLSQADGDLEAAGNYASRAFALRTNAGWAFDAVVALGLDSGDWRQTREKIEIGRKNGVIETAPANRAVAALLTAEADNCSDDKMKLALLERAMKLAPEFAPAVIFAARADIALGKKNAAIKILERGFTARAHPAFCAEILAVIKEDESAIQAETFRRMATKNPTSREATILRARANLLLDEYDAASTVVEELLTGEPNAGDFTLMAEIAAAQYGDAAAGPWIEKAAAAPLDNRLGANGEFNFSKSVWAALIREFMEHDRLSPPPIERYDYSLSGEELQLLLAPPTPMPEAEVSDDFAEKSDLSDENRPLKSDIEPPEKATSVEAGEDDSEVSEEDSERLIAAARGVS